jgi:hypothetical protein
MDNLVNAILDSLKRLGEFRTKITSITPYPYTPEVHLNPSIFFENFDNYKGFNRNCNKYPIELSEIVEGVKFFCICTVEDFNHVD